MQIKTPVHPIKCLELKEACVIKVTKIFLHDKRNIPSFKIPGHCAQTKLRMLIWSLGAFIKSKVKNLTHL